MLFNSYIFLGFLLLCMVIYYAGLSAKKQVVFLVLASFVFYAYSFPALLLLLLFSIAINTVTTYQVYFGEARRQKMYVTLGVIINLAVLAFFKYSPLVSRMFFDPKSEAGAFLLSIPLPIGISFFTFHGISMLVDIYRKKGIQTYGHVLTPSWGWHAVLTSLYIAFFPQLVAGPIVKSYNFLPQISKKYFKDIMWEPAIRMLILGYFLKMVIADNLKDQTFWIAYPYFLGQSSVTLVTMLFGYSMQIFADFAGYSLIALGLAELFGYHLQQNFNYPYISRTFSEFWTRWHISLSSWLREYLYFSLGGNRKGKFRTYLNLMIVMFLGGLWHGAAWSYAVWGSFHGLALAVERFIADRVKIKETILVKFFQTILVFAFVTFAWLLFKLPNFSDAVEYVKAMVHNVHAPTNFNIIFYILLYSLPVVILHLFYLAEEKVGKRLWIQLQPVVYGFLLFAIIVNSGSAGDFIYFQF